MSVVRLIFATRSSGPPASGKIIKEMPVSVASGAFYISVDRTRITLVYIASHHSYGQVGPTQKIYLLTYLLTYSMEQSPS